MTSPRARRGRGVALAAALLAGAAAVASEAAPASSPAGAEPPLQCSVRTVAQGRAGASVELRYRLANGGPAAWWVLDWNTPFEPGWFGRYVEVWRDGQPLDYRGAMLKRGEPAADDYLRLPAGRARLARVDLAQAFDLSRPGRYRVVTALVLHDLVRDGERRPRGRDALVPRPLNCNPVEFELR